MNTFIFFHFVSILWACDVIKWALSKCAAVAGVAMVFEFSHVWYEAGFQLTGSVLGFFAQLWPVWVRTFCFLNYHSPLSLSFHHFFVPPPLFYFWERERCLACDCFVQQSETQAVHFILPGLFTPPFSFSSLTDDPLSMLLPLWSSSITSPSFSNSASFT